MSGIECPRRSFGYNCGMGFDLPPIWLLGVWVAWGLQALWGWQNAHKFKRLVHGQGERDDGRKRWYQPPAAVIVPVKGAGEALAEHLAGLTRQDYPQYRLIFVTESEGDPAYAVLREFQSRFAASAAEAQSCRGVTVRVAGLTTSGSQKVHNQLCGLAETTEADEVIVFADADAVTHAEWLWRLVRPLIKQYNGVTTGYRWLVPVDDRLASRFASAINASVATLAGPERWNHAWGGSMAIRRTALERIELAGHWRGALSDDYQMTRAVRGAGLRVYFVARSLVASPTSLGWRGLLRFGRRQYLITRVYSPGIWLVALGGLGLYVGGWLTALAALASGNAAALAPMALVYLFDMQRASTRQAAVELLFDRPVRERLRPVFALDRWATPAWMAAHLVIVLSSAVGRRIEWGGIVYQMRHRRDVRIISR